MQRFLKEMMHIGLLAIITISTALGQSTPTAVNKLTACIDVPTEANCTGAGATIYPWFNMVPDVTNGKMGEMPEPIAKLLKALPSKEVIIPEGLRAEYVSQPSYVVSIPGFGTTPDYLISQEKLNDAPRERLQLWVRSFEGINPEDTVYLVSIAVYCDYIDDYFARHTDSKELRYPGCTKIPVSNDEDDDFEDTATKEDAWDLIRKQRSENARIARIRAYRIDSNGIPKDVTDSVLPPLSVLALSTKELKQYWQRGFTGVYVDDSHLVKVPVFRWVAALDSDEPKLKNDSRAIFSDRIHFSYVVWNGKQFESHKRVSRALWPCLESSSGEPFCEDEFLLEAATKK